MGDAFRGVYAVFEFGNQRQSNPMFAGVAEACIPRKVAAGEHLDGCVLQQLYGGWYDGNPAQLKPARDALVASELASLSGGALKLAERARELAETDARLACHLAEFAMQAEPDNKAVHALRAEVYQRRREGETSLMAKGIFGSAANQSKQQLDSD